MQYEEYILSCYMKALSLLVEKFKPRLRFFFKIRGKFKIKVKIFGKKGLVTRNPLLISFDPRVIAKVKFTVDRQTDGQKGIFLCTPKTSFAGV